MSAARLTAAGLLAGFAAPVAADCPKPEAHIEAANKDIQDFFLAEAREQLDAAAAAFGCSAAARPETLSAWWQADGIIHLLQGDTWRAESAFGAAGRVAPAAFNPIFGPEAEALFRAPPPVGAGTLQVDALQRRDVLLVDGKPNAASQPVGLHWVQVGPLPGAARFAVEVRIEADTRTLIVVPPPVVPDPAARFANAGGPSRGGPTERPLYTPSRALAAGGGLAWVGAAGAMVGATAAHEAFLGSSSRAEAERHLRRNHVAGLGAGALGLAGAGLLSLAVVQGEW